MNRTFPVDLQTHTTFSDGTDTPEELVSKAAAAGIRVLAATDHDSVRGVAAARTAGAEAGVHVLPAIELSTTKEEDRGFLDIHVLGYGIDPDDPTLQETLKEPQLQFLDVELDALRCADQQTIRDPTGALTTVSVNGTLTIVLSTPNFVPHA